MTTWQVDVLKPRQQIIMKKKCQDHVNFVFADMHGNLKLVVKQPIRIGLSFLLVHYYY